MRTHRDSRHWDLPARADQQKLMLAGCPIAGSACTAAAQLVPNHVRFVIEAPLGRQQPAIDLVNRLQDHSIVKFAKGRIAGP
jgi:hypothetical protein